jgi:hypothetical protein
MRIIGFPFPLTSTLKYVCACAVTDAKTTIRNRTSEAGLLKRFIVFVFKT